MELVINKRAKTSKKTRVFETVITFYVHGSSDKKVIQHFDEDKLSSPNYKSEVEDFIISVIECVKLDSGGRGGINKPHELLAHYSKSKTWAKMCYTALENIDDAELGEYGIDDEEAPTYTNLRYYIPTNSVGYYANYSSFDMFYYDENGDKFTVTPKF